MSLRNLKVNTIITSLGKVKHSPNQIYTQQKHSENEERNSHEDSTNLKWRKDNRGIGKTVNSFVEYL